MKKSVRIAVKTAFSFLALIWFFFSYEIDNHAGDLNDSPFRAIMSPFDGEVGVKNSIRIYLIMFTVILLLTFIVFVLSELAREKSVLRFTALWGFFAALEMILRYVFFNSFYGNFTYIPALLLLIVIAIGDMKECYEKTKE